MGAALSLALLSLLLSWPGLSGSWVYDDLRMVGNPFYDGWDDVGAVFQRTAVDYFRAHGGSNATASETYRPVTMACLIATHVMSPTPLAHHMVGWAMHLLVALLLWRTLAVRAGNGVATALAAVFLLHPVGVEAYVWINGRSDVSAAVFVMASAVLVEALVVPSPHATPPSRSPARRLGVAALAALLAFVAVGSKETCLPALAAIWLAGVARASAARPEARRLLLVGMVGASLGVTGYLTAWSAVSTGTIGSLGPGGPGLLDGAVLRFAPKLAAIGAGALVAPRAAPMQSYVWLATRTLSAVEWAAAALAVLAIVWLLRRRDLSGLILAGGALASLLPTALLLDVIWLGLDRYLYLPLLLLLLAAAPHVTALVTAANPRLRGTLAAVGVVFAGLVMTSTWMASGYYEDHRTWMVSGVAEAPEDPTRYLMMAKELMDNGHPDAARATLAYLPPPPWPRAVILGMLEVTLELGDDAAYDTVLARAVASGVEHPGVDMHRIHRALRAGNVADALRLVPGVGATDVCPELAGHLRAAAARTTGADRAALLRAFAGLPCVARVDVEP